MNETLIARRLNAEQFLGIRKDWEALQKNTDANNLFCSWSWMYSWWEAWGARLGLELMLIAVYDNDELVGVGPFCVHRNRRFPGIPVDRVYIIGNAWKVAPTVRSEYLGLIVEVSRAKTITHCIVEALCQHDWQELLLSDVTEDTRRALGDALGVVLGKPPLSLIRKQEFAVVVDTDKPFAGWLSELGKNTRLKLYNRRQYLQSMDQVDVTELPVDQANQFFASLNSFHQIRWGAICFNDKVIDFYQALFDRMPASMTVFLRVIEQAGTPISVVFDIKVNDSYFNIQSGYAEHFDSKLSLGTIHLGFAIESAFNDPEACAYNLLAGEGKHTFYKTRYNGRLESLSSLHLVRSPGLKLAYRVALAMPGKAKRHLNKFFRL